MNRRACRAAVVLAAFSLALCLEGARATAAPEAPAQARERSAEPLYRDALALANKPGATDAQIVQAIAAALEAGACPTRTLTEGAFAGLHTNARFHELIREHAHQWSTCILPPDEPGESMQVSGVVLDDKGQPIAAALVYVFQTDATGHYAPGSMNERLPRLFGYMRTDAQGRFEFKTIRPGHYPDIREPVEQHIHGEISAPGFKDKQFRIGFRDDPFWKQQDRAAPWWAVDVRPNAEGVQQCAVEIRLTSPAGPAAE